MGLKGIIMKPNNLAIQNALKEKYPNNKIDLNIVYGMSMDLEMVIEVDSVQLNQNISLSTVEYLASRLNESVSQVLLKLICVRVDDYFEEQKA